MQIRNILLFFILLLISINVSSAYYTFIGDVQYRDTDNVLKPVPYAYVEIYNSTWGYRVVADANGHFISGVPGQSMYYVSVSRDGYVSTTYTKWMNSNESDYDIIIDKESAPNYIVPHYVKFTVKSFLGTEYKNVEAKLYYNNSLTSTKKTGTDGGVGYELSENEEYRITFINSTQGISREWKGYPTDNEYIIYVFSTSPVPEDREVDDILFGLNNDRINVSTGYINVTFEDTSITTTSANLKIYEGSLNGTLFYSSTTTHDNETWNVLVPANNTNYTVYFSVDNAQLAEPLIITRLVTFYDSNRYDLGFDDGWNYILIAVVIIVGIFALFSRVNAEVGAVVGVMTGWFFWMLGWLNSGLDNDARLTMGLMLLLGTLIAAGAYIRKGEDV